MPVVTRNSTAPQVPQVVGDTTLGTPTKAFRSSVSNSDDFDEKVKLSVVQQRGRFKVISENIALEKWTVPKPATRKWLKPPTNCYALNTDGSLGATGVCGAILRRWEGCIGLYWQKMIKLQLTTKKQFLYDIVANGRNGIDLDKFDYIVRDCRACGLGCNFQFQRQLENSTVRFLVKLMETMRAMGDEICYRAKDC
ncbi:hypothetical protein GIB67_001402 [Kingdonia uniflora]|uniref:Uncharacterized protein n=1 Tax=Kingdonia uniflora TaxID=39325 RepID=A0A7J7N7S3_9MAGN|nr:hypothetical protein GIB67_001402 [Kingdonia uniflora]